VYNSVSGPGSTEQMWTCLSLSDKQEVLPLGQWERFCLWGRKLGKTPVPHTHTETSTAQGTSITSIIHYT